MWQPLRTLAAGLVVLVLVLTGGQELPGDRAPHQAGGAVLPGFEPQAIVAVGGTRDVIVAGTVPCASGDVCPELLRGSLGTGGRVGSWHRTQAPPVPRAAPGERLDIGSVTFANARDGYDLVSAYGPGGADDLYATTDGGASWRHVEGLRATVLTLAAAPSGVYAVTAQCRAGACHDYRLARSKPGAALWESTPVPGTGELGGGPIGLSVLGHEVVMNFDPPVLGAKPRILVSRGGRAPFEVLPGLPSQGACELSPEPGGAVWAACPTGMLVSYLHSPSLQGRYTSVWVYAGTGGGGLVPIGGAVAYRWTGIPTYGAVRLAGHLLQRTIDGGRSFATAGPWPFAVNAGTVARFVFLDERDGFGLGPTPGEPTRAEIVETTDGGTHWARVLP